MKKEFRDFESARKYVQNLKLKNTKDWYEFSKSGDKPDDIPVNPNRVYKNNGWTSIGDWLGTGSISNKQKSENFTTYEKASQICKNLKIISGEQFLEYYEKGLISKNIPASPPNVYHKFWNKNGGWGGFLGTGKVSNQNRKFLDYEDARKFIQKVTHNGKKISGDSDFRNWSKSGNRPDNIPANPERTYKKIGAWKGWGDFTGSGRIANDQKTIKEFDDARKFVQSLKLKNQKEWYAFTKSKNFPTDLPSAPHTAYKKNGWIGYGDFLGTGKVASQLIEYRKFTEARKFVRSLKLGGQKDWARYCKSGNKPEDIPAAPWKTYHNKGWVDLGDWTGSGNQSNRVKSKQYLSFSEAREEARRLAKKFNIKTTHDWQNAIKKGWIPKNIPSNPNQVYSKKKITSKK